MKIITAPIRTAADAFIPSSPLHRNHRLPFLATSPAQCGHDMLVLTLHPDLIDPQESHRSERRLRSLDLP